jgi:hypothetical protein
MAESAIYSDCNTRNCSYLINRECFKVVLEDRVLLSVYYEIFLTI